MRRAIFPVLVVIWITLAAASTAAAQVQHLETKVDHDIGQSIEFTAGFVSDRPVAAAVVYFQAEGDNRWNVGFAKLNKPGRDKYQASYTHPISEYMIQPFSSLSYYWELYYSDQDLFTSQTEEYAYDDDRFDWQVVERDGIQVHWYQGDRQFAEDMLDLAKKGNQEIQQILPLPEAGDLDIYIYSDAEVLQAALLKGTTDWVAGHADPRLGVIAIALPEVPEQRLLAEQRIPHELVHILLYRYTKVGYQYLPAWLSEGLASSAELYPNPEYRFILMEASRSGDLLPLPSLCVDFQSDPSPVMLSYAESLSFVQYLHGRYGTPGLQALITAYANGWDCESGAEQALGRSLYQLEKNWQRDLALQDSLASPAASFLPWVVVFLAVLVAPLLMVVYKIGSRQNHQQSK
jgi:hypothetical protein